MYALLPVKPQYAEAIMIGTKRFELRRRRPNLPPGTVVFLYSTAPEMAVVGLAISETIVTAPLDFLWHRVRHECGLDREGFLRYFSGCTSGHAVKLAEPNQLVQSLPLHVLRSVSPHYQPPQFYHRITETHPFYGLLDAACRLASNQYLADLKTNALKRNIAAVKP